MDLTPSENRCCEQNGSGECGPCRYTKGVDTCCFLWPGLSLKACGETHECFRRRSEATPGASGGYLEFRSGKHLKSAGVAAVQMQLNLLLLAWRQFAVDEGAECFLAEMVAGLRHWSFPSCRIKRWQSVSRASEMREMTALIGISSWRAMSRQLSSSLSHSSSTSRSVGGS